MGSKLRDFSRDFRLEVCRKVVSGEASKSGTMRAHRLGAGTLERWLEQYAVRGEAAFDGRRWRAPAEAETAESKLRRELEALKAENEFLRACLGKSPAPPETRPADPGPPASGVLCGEGARGAGPGALQLLRARGPSSQGAAPRRAGGGGVPAIRVVRLPSGDGAAATRGSRRREEGGSRLDAPPRPPRPDEAPPETKPRRKRTTVPVPVDPANLLAAEPATAPRRVLAVDASWIPLGEGRGLYLAAVLDLFTRQALGLALGTRLDTKLTLAALAKALARGMPEAGWIHHSDRGSTYASEEYRRCVAAVAGRSSFTKPGSPQQNGAMESFFKTLKAEETSRNEHASPADAVRAVERFVDFYNKERLHSSLGYESPDRYERAHALQCKQAPPQDRPESG